MEKETFSNLGDDLKEQYLRASASQMEEVNDIRGEYVVAAKALLEKYMEKEKAVYNKIIV